MRPALYGREWASMGRGTNSGQSPGMLLSRPRTGQSPQRMTRPRMPSFEAEKPGFEGGREGKTGNEVVEVEAGPARQAALEIVTGISQKNRNNNHSSS